MRQLAAIGRRLAAFVATLAGAALLAQALLWLAPGDAVDLLTDDPELRDQMIASWGLDQPLLVRWWRFVTGAATGDLGVSLTYRPGTEVSSLVWRASLASAPTLVSAVLLALIGGVGLAYARLRVGRRLIQVVSVAPVFLLAATAVVTLNETAFSLIEAGTITRPEWFALPLGDSLLKSVLGVVVLAIGSSALTEVHQAADDELRIIRGSGYIDAATARGARLWPHILWNLLPPLTTIAVSRTAFFLGGLVVVEKVLQLNGAGAMLWQACRLRDYPLALGLVLVAAAVVCTARLVGDVIRIGLDPRLRVAR
ncbi:MAG: ABC transporter permease [Proteobacteria bacterium]|nr:ABC transporter permease [Pseudomonadota bacterium]MCP4921592.1 ABC transporter permease [Pseudomonadota bacterium]